MTQGFKAIRPLPKSETDYNEMPCFSTAESKRHVIYDNNVYCTFCLLRLSHALSSLWISDQQKTIKLSKSPELGNECNCSVTMSNVIRCPLKENREQTSKVITKKWEERWRISTYSLNLWWRELIIRSWSMISHQALCFLNPQAFDSKEKIIQYSGEDISRIYHLKCIQSNIWHTHRKNYMFALRLNRSLILTQ